MTWTPEAVDTLRSLWTDGMSITQIGKRIGKTRNAVIGKAMRIGLQKRGEPEMLACGKARPGLIAADIRPAPVLPVTPATVHACQYIAGAPTADDACKCRQPTLPGKPYCEAHATLCYSNRLSEPPDYVPHRQRVGSKLMEPVF